jgi:hypothetical protein
MPGGNWLSRHLTALAVLVMLMLAAVGAASADAQRAQPEGAAVIAIVNGQRAANGIPPITTIDKAYASSWCPNEEAPLQEGETGRVSAQLAGAWSATHTPYSTAPLHQFVIYAPLATVAGDARTSSGTDCMGVGEPGLGASTLASAPSFYAWVNEKGPRAAVSSEVARELPMTPPQELGEPANERTGPQILLYALGLGLAPTATGVSLSTANGTVVPGAKIANVFLGGVLVPPPLRPGTSYRLQVQWTDMEPAIPAPILSEGQAPSGPEPATLVAGETATQVLDFATARAPAKPKRPSRRRKRVARK